MTTPPDGRLDHPPALAAFPLALGLRLLAGADVRATPAQLAAFRRYAQLGDPPADRLVAALGALPADRGRAMVERALADGVDAVPDAPPELRELVDRVAAVPYWVDTDQLALAARVTGRAGLWGMLVALPYLALMGGYLASRPDKVLVATGDLDTAAPRRLAETAHWWVDVTSPGALDRHGPGFAGVLRVRLVHARVRAAMRARPDWDHERWDAPVNQAQLAGTLMLFSLANLAGCQAIGLRFTARERAAVFHLWRYVGWLLGVTPDLLPATEADTWRLLWLEAATEFRPDADSRRLAGALADALGPLLVPGDGRLSGAATRALNSYATSYSRLVLGRANADALGLPASTPFRAAVLATAAANRTLEYARAVVPGSTRLGETLGHRGRVALARRMLRAQRATPPAAGRRGRRGG
ncbi:MAG TPA: oxygenase MpaB family protein [Pseudonocardia sp.]|jgi:hypothetical protein